MNRFQGRHRLPTWKIFAIGDALSGCPPSAHCQPPPDPGIRPAHPRDGLSMPSTSPCCPSAGFHSYQDPRPPPTSNPLPMINHWFIPVRDTSMAPPVHRGSRRAPISLLLAEQRCWGNSHPASRPPFISGNYQNTSICSSVSIWSSSAIGMEYGQHTDPTNGSQRSMTGPGCSPPPFRISNVPLRISRMSDPVPCTRHAAEPRPMATSTS